MDREKVIKGLETIKAFFGDGLPSTAEMFDSYYGILNDAISMLKEQEAVGVKRRVEETEWNVCGNCGGHLIHKWQFCPYCGRTAKWE